MIISSKQLSDFNTNGYIVLPAFLPADLIQKLKSEVDHWVDEGLREKSIAKARDRDPPAMMEFDLREHGWLISHPPLMTILEQILGPGFAYHHLHSDRHDFNSGDKNWHHDYEQYPQSNRSHTMIHVLHYLSKLDGDTADLVVVPGTHRKVMDKAALHSFGTRPLPGEVVINHVPEGTTIIMHSAALHARRVKPQKNRNWRRYFIDCSYCQQGVQWPQVKGYWRAALAHARKLGLDRNRWPSLFDEKHFYDLYDFLPRFNEINQGSLLGHIMEKSLTKDNV